LAFTFPVLADGKVADLIESRNQQWADAFNSGDVERLSSIFGERFIVLPPGSEAITDRNDLRSFLQQDMKSLSNLNLRTTSVTVVGNFAYETGEASYQMHEESGKLTRSIDDYLVVWRKDDGIWNYYVDLWWPQE